METRRGPLEVAGPQPDFYKTIVGCSLTTEQIEKAHNHVVVDDIDVALEQIKDFSDSRILREKFDVIGIDMAIIQDPYGNIVFLNERKKRL